MAFPDVQFRKLFTQSLTAVVREEIRPTQFLKSFFPTPSGNSVRPSKYLSYIVQRGFEKVAKDVSREGAEPQFNQLGDSTQKVIKPPYYYEAFNVNELDLYEEVIARPTQANFRALVQESSRLMRLQREKIERAYELKCAQFLEDGVVQLDASTDIDYERNDEYHVDLAGYYWDNSPGSAKPWEHVENRCKFVRQEGKATVGTMDMVIGEKSWHYLKETESFKEHANFRRASLVDISTPQANAEGAQFHGFITAGSYEVRVWTYPQFYTNSNGNMTEYVDPKKFIILPSNPNWNFEFALVPQVLSGGVPPQTNQEFLIQDFVDPRRKSHEMTTESAGICLPYSVDQVYTAKAVS